MEQLNGIISILFGGGFIIFTLVVIFKIKLDERRPKPRRKIGQ